MNEVIGFIGIAILVIVQISAFAYTFGQLHGKVASIDRRLNDLLHRIERIENRVYNPEERK